MSLGVFSFGHFRDLPVIILEEEIGLINPYINMPNQNLHGIDCVQPSRCYFKSSRV